MVLFECNAIYVKDVEDRSNTPNGCNAFTTKETSVVNGTVHPRSMTDDVIDICCKSYSTLQVNDYGVNYRHICC